MKHARKDTKRIAAALESIADGPAARSTDRDTKDKVPFLCWLRVKIFVSDKRSTLATAGRRAKPIQAYVGPNGGGKSLAMVEDTLPTLHGVRWVCDEPEHEHTKAGVTQGWRTVLSTVTILDADTGLPHPLYRAFVDFDQLLAAEHCDVLMDEVVGIASSRESASMDGRVQNVLVQLRRRDVVVRWTAPNWARADKIIREVTQAVTECRGYYSAPVKVQDGDVVGSLWAPRRLFHFRTFDTVDFEDWSAGKRDKLQPLVKEWFYGVGSRAFASYNTMGAVSRVAHASASGLCETCGGTIRRKACTCGTARRVEFEPADVAAELRGPVVEVPA